MNHVIGSSFRLDSNRHEACGLLQSIPGILRDASGFSRFLGDFLGDSWGFFFFGDSSQFFGILKDF